MFISPQNPVPESHPVDAVFALLAGGPPTPLMPSEMGTPLMDEAKPTGPPPLDPPEPPPGLDADHDLRTAYEWLQTERARLEQYTRMQYEKVQEQHQELMALHFQHEQDAALQAQEINREIQRLATFSESLDDRSKKLDDREADLTGQEDKLAHVREEVENFQRKRRELQAEVEAQRELTHELEARAARLHVKEDAARNDFRALESKLESARRQWDEREGDLATRQAELEQHAGVLKLREAELASQSERLTELHREVETFQQTRQSLEEEINTRRTTADELEKRTAVLRTVEVELRGECETWQQRFADIRKAWDEKEVELTERQAELDRRAHELAERESALTEQKAELTKAAEEVVAIVQKRKTLEKDIRTQLALAEELRGRTARLQEKGAKAQTEFQEIERRLSESYSIWRTKETELAERYSKLEQRYQDLERSEEAVKRRMTELDEMEYRLESEFERQEKQLAMDCREIDRLRAILREHGLDPENHAKAGGPARGKRQAIRVE